MSLQIQRPAPRALQIHIAIYVDQGERKLFQALLEVDPSGLDINAGSMRGNFSGGGINLRWRLGAGGGKPSLNIPRAA